MRAHKGHLQARRSASSCLDRETCQEFSLIFFVSPDIQVGAGRGGWSSMPPQVRKSIPLRAAGLSKLKARCAIMRSLLLSPLLRSQLYPQGQVGRQGKGSGEPAPGRRSWFSYRRSVTSPRTATNKSREPNLGRTRFPSRRVPPRAPSHCGKSTAQRVVKGSPKLSRY